MTYYHPKYYAALRAQKRKLQAPSLKPQASSSKRRELQAASLKPQAIQAPSSKPQAPSGKLQAPSRKRQAP